MRGIMSNTVKEYNDKKLGIYSLTLIALLISILILFFYNEGWKDWVVVLSAIVGAIGGVITGERVNR
jgi:uncharacterized membrane protein YfcA